MDRTVFIAGQLTGVEGYVESVSSGLVAGINGTRLLDGQSPIVFSELSVIGSLINYITCATSKNFQPMNANLGILPPLPEKIRDKKDRKLAYAKRALEALDDMIEF